MQGKSEHLLFTHAVVRRPDAARAIEACRRAGVPLGLGYNKRFWPSMRELKRIVDSGVLCGVRTTPRFWRVHVFGRNGSAEALEDVDVVVRMTDSPPRRLAFERVDALRLELEAFGNAVAGGAPYPIPFDQMLDGVAALEATIKSLEVKSPVVVTLP